MFTKVLLVCSLVAAAQAGLIAAGHGAVSSQSIVLGHPAPVVRAVAPAWGAPAWGAPAWGAPAWGAPAWGGVGLGHGALVSHAPIAPIAPIVHAAPVAHAVAAEVYAHPRYQFNYGVADGHTGDQKNQWEARDGDVVKGSYSVAEPDGTVRTVNYSADDHNGFNAVVSRHGHAAHPGVVAHAPVVAAHGALLHG